MISKQINQGARLPKLPESPKVHAGPGFSPPRPDRRGVSLPEVHRQICDWLRLEGIKELLLRELLTVSERIPA
jgi:hypothetical protein